MPRVEIFQDEAGEYRWHRKADNGEIIATSGEGYTKKSHATGMAMANFPNDPVMDEMPEPDAAVPHE